MKTSSKIILAFLAMTAAGVFAIPPLCGHKTDKEDSNFIRKVSLGRDVSMEMPLGYSLTISETASIVSDTCNYVSRYIDIEENDSIGVAIITVDAGWKDDITFTKDSTGIVTDIALDMHSTLEGNKFRNVLINPSDSVVMKIEVPRGSLGEIVTGSYVLRLKTYPETEMLIASPSILLLPKKQ